MPSTGAQMMNSIWKKLNRLLHSSLMRDEWLRAEGYQVLRFWDNQIFCNLKDVLENIRNTFLIPHPEPLVQGERENKF